LEIKDQKLLHGKRMMIALFLVAVTSATVGAQKSSGPAAGTLIVDGGGTTKVVVDKFVELAGGPQARIVVFPTGASAIRFGEQNIILDPDWPRDRNEWRDYNAYLRKWFGVDDIQILHTRDRNEADTERFVEPLKSATGVYLAPGNSGRYAAAYLGTRTVTELRTVLDREV
jgi:cyanophycinase